jgi:ribosomal protein S18 acetylase RimI-like enzyme
VSRGRPEVIQVRRAEPAEAELVHRVMRAAFAEYEGVLRPPSGANEESVADVARAMQADGGAVLAFVGAEAVGSARYRLAADHLEVGRVAVLPAWRRRGVASRLMRFCEALAPRLGRDEVRVDVRAALPGNRALYERLGYAVLRVEPHSRGGDDVVTLARRITP